MRINFTLKLNPETLPKKESRCNEQTFHLIELLLLFSTPSGSHTAASAILYLLQAVMQRKNIRLRLLRVHARVK